MNVARAALGAAAILVLSAAARSHHIAPAAPHTISPLLPPELVVAHYQDELVHAAPPPALIFEYTVEQVGPHDIEQTHRVYRQDTSERDEILAIDGRSLPGPSVTISTRRTDRYDITSVAPRQPQYEFSFVRSLQIGERVDYVFRTVSRTGTAFSVSDLTIDGDSFLPSVIDFRSTDAAGRAFGRLTYGRVGDHWLIRDASVSAHVDGAPVRERITWMNYQFPVALPPSTFAQRDRSQNEPLAVNAY
jgi:hypothetical protein